MSERPTAGPPVRGLVAAAGLGGPGSGLAELLDTALHHRLGRDAAAVTVLSDGQPTPADADVLAVMGHRRDLLTRWLTPGIHWVHVLATGVDGFPFDLLGDRELTCSRGASSLAIAEFTLAAMLAFEKHLPEVWLTEPPPHWHLANLGTLAGRTLGLVGLGAIATETARRAMAFQMRVVAFRRRAVSSPVPGVRVSASLPAMLAESDHVVVAAPATPGTRHLLDEATFAAMKRGVHLVNVSRGSLVDQEALRQALDDGRVARATLDVVEPEPLPSGHWLYRHPGVRLSAHVSWSAPDTLARTMDDFARNLLRYRAGEPLDGVVDVDAGY